MREAWIIDAARTPRGIGKPGQGALSSVHAQRILSTVLRALQARNGLNTDDIDEVIMGCFAKSGEQDGCIARLAALDAGWGAAVPEIGRAHVSPVTNAHLVCRLLLEKKKHLRQSDTDRL